MYGQVESHPLRALIFIKKTYLPIIVYSSLGNVSGYEEHTFLFCKLSVILIMDIPKLT